MHLSGRRLKNLNAGHGNCQEPLYGGGEYCNSKHQLITQHSVYDYYNYNMRILRTMFASCLIFLVILSLEFVKYHPLTKIHFNLSNVIF